jgi:hypothetical protein
MSDLDDAVVAALDRTWAKIQKSAGEADVPDAIWYLTSGRSASCATGPWNTPEHLLLRLNLKQDLPGVLADDQPNRNAEDLLSQLLHWGAHAATGISTGAEGRYHSREFADVAERLGLLIHQAPGVGWAPKVTDRPVDGRRQEVLSPAALKRFAPEIKALDKAMKSWSPETDDAARKQGRGPVSLACLCVPPRIFRASTGVALGPDIICSVCGKPFRVTPGQRISEAHRT